MTAGPRASENESGAAMTHLLLDGGGGPGHGGFGRR